MPFNGIIIIFTFIFPADKLFCCRCYSFIYIVHVVYVELWITTECDRLQVVPGEIVVIPLGFHFVVDLPDGSSHGYVAEIFGTHFQLLDLGQMGAAKILKVIISCAIIWY